MKPPLKLALSFAAGAIAAILAGTALHPREDQDAAQRPPAGGTSAPQRPGGGSASSRREGAPPLPATAQAHAAGAASQTDLAAREQAERAQVVSLQARVRELERRAAASEAAPDRDPQRAKFHDFTDAELQAMAQNCEVRFDLPRIGREPFHLAPDLGARLHLSDPEQAQVSAAADGVSKDVVAHLRAFYLEATGDAAGADALDPQSLMREVMAKSPPAAVQAARAELARERAGFPPAPTGTIAERYLRYLTSVGDSLQRSLEPALGAQQAGAVRDGLSESSSSMSGCTR